MNVSKKKAMLLSGAVLASLSCGIPQAIAASPAPQHANQAETRIRGVVTDDKGEPLIGASVMVKGTSRGTATDLDGKYELDAKIGETLVFSYVGYVASEVKVGSSPVVDVQLQENNNDLDELLVVGYGTQKKKLFTGANFQVKGDQIAQMNTSNALTALQSQAPGMQITQSSTQPGKGYKVAIRGVGTIGESSPLLVIDGIPSGTVNDGLNGINPNDIETIDVLKDAASAAIYGSAAANGVVLVTTKQGKEGKISITYDGFVGWSNPYRQPGNLNAQQYMQVVDETNFNTYGSTTNWAAMVPQSILDKVKAGWQGEDWFNIYRNKNAFQHSHAVSLTGGSDRSKFSISVNYSDQDGILGGDNASDYKRYGGRINSEHVLVKGKNHSIVTIGENVSYWYHTSHDLAEGNGYWNIMQPVYATSPLVPAFNEDGTPTNFRDNGAGWSSMIFSNPYEGFINGQYNSLNRSRDFGFGATLYWIVEPIKGLKYRGQLNTGYSGGANRNMSKPYSASSTSANSNYSLNQSSYENSSLTFDNTITYELPSFNGHNIDIMVGQSIEQSNWSNSLSVSMTESPDSPNFSSLFYNGWDFVIPHNYSKDALTGFDGTDAPKKGARAAFFGRLNYNYEEKYMLTAILRRDGSSNFARGHRWKTYPSVSAGWVISNENFMEGLSGAIDFLKIRAGWGQNGNDDTRPYGSGYFYLSNIGFSPTNYADYGYKFGSSNLESVSGKFTTGAYAKNVPNPDLTWETSEQLDLGLDARFLNSRLSLAFDYYVKTTKDWLLRAPLNDILGYEEAAMINGGRVKNSGVEFSLGWNDNIGGEFNYNISVSGAFNKNKVVELATSSGKLGDNISSSLFENSSYVALVEEGHPLGYFSGMSHSGIWQTQAQIDEARSKGQAVLANAQPGDFIWDDYNHDGVITFDGDRHDIGNPHPDFTLGLTLGFNWKGLDFSAAGSGAFGMQAMQCYRTALLANPYLNYTTEVLDRWHGPGTSNTVPRLTVGGENNQWVSTYYMQNADYFKVQNITLGYDFNRLIKKNIFQQLRFYVQAQNLCTITKYKGVDPEIGSNGGTDNNWIRGLDTGLYPSARTFIVGVTVKY